MSATTAYQCDGPKCPELTTRVKGARFPEAWLRVALTLPNGETKRGSFHRIDCLHAWVEQQLGNA